MGRRERNFGRILDDAQPEAAYFFAREGKRGGLLIVNLTEASEMPRFGTTIPQSK
jgi:hypothetical protein